MTELTQIGPYLEAAYTIEGLKILWDAGKPDEARRLVERAAAAGASARGLRALRRKLATLEAGS